MSGFCLESTDCIAPFVSGGLLGFYPIISGESNALACTADGLLSRLESDCFELEDVPSENAKRLKARISTDAGNALECHEDGLYAALSAVGTSAASVDGETAILIEGAASGQIGPTLLAVIGNPSLLEPASVLGLMLGTTEQVAMNNNNVWAVVLQASLDGGGSWVPVGVNRYSTQGRAEGATEDAYRFAYGANATMFTGVLPPGGTITLGLRKMLAVERTEGTRAGTVEDTGSMEIRAMEVAA